MKEKYIFTGRENIPVSTVEAVIKMIMDEGLSIYNSGKDHQGIEFWPSPKEVIKLITEKN